LKAKVSTRKEVNTFFANKNFMNQKEIIEMVVNQVLDAKGLTCPMPIVRTKKAMDTLESGQVLEVKVTDKGALADLTAWSAAAGHTLLEHKEEAEVLTFFIKKS
jgi:tRNA 2-thiouridine synthesizing protein A